MLLANRPWQLVSDLSKVIVTALATGAYAVVTSSIWPMADQLGAARLLLLGVLAVAALVGWLIVAHELWERPSSSAARRANTATVLTLFTGLLLGYLVLFALVLLSAVLVIPDSYLQSILRHPITLGDYVALAWFLSSLATVEEPSGLASNPTRTSATRSGVTKSCRLKTTTVDDWRQSR